MAWLTHGLMFFLGVFVGVFLMGILQMARQRGIDIDSSSLHGLFPPGHRITIVNGGPDGEDSEVEILTPPRVIKRGGK